MNASTFAPVKPGRGPRPVSPVGSACATVSRPVSPMAGSRPPSPASTKSKLTSRGREQLEPSRKLSRRWGVLSALTRSDRVECRNCEVLAVKRVKMPAGLLFAESWFVRCSVAQDTPAGGVVRAGCAAGAEASERTCAVRRAIASSADGVDRSGGSAYSTARGALLPDCGPRQTSR